MDGRKAGSSILFTLLYDSRISFTTSITLLLILSPSSLLTLPHSLIMITTTIHTLPNELLGEILGHAMHIPDELFTSNAARSPFGSYAHPYAARRYLLVNKRWRDAGLRPLYRDVVLRSRAQATALARTLRQNPELALMVHKLRVEGGLGVSMVVILATCTNITD